MSASVDAIRRLGSKALPGLMASFGMSCVEPGEWGGGRDGAGLGRCKSDEDCDLECDLHCCPPDCPCDVARTKAAAEQIQALYLTGKKMEAMAAVPDALVDEVALCGPRERIAERLAAWKTSGITTMICGTSDINALRMMAELVL